MDILDRSYHSSRARRSPGRALVAMLAGLLLIAALTPVADTLWAERLSVSGEVESGPFEPTPSETAQPTITPTPTPNFQAGASLEADITAQTRWKEDAAGQAFTVFGEVCASNAGDLPTIGLSIFIQAEINPKQTDWQPLPGASLLIDPEQPLPRGETACFMYEIELAYQPDTAYRNSAWVSILNQSGWLPGSENCPGDQPCRFGPQPRVDVEPPPDESGADRSAPITDPTATPLPPGEPSPTEPPTSTPSPTVEPSPTPTPLLPTETPPPTEPPPTEPPPTESPPTEEPAPTEPPPTEEPPPGG